MLHEFQQDHPEEFYQSLEEFKTELEIENTTTYVKIIREHFENIFREIGNYSNTKPLCFVVNALEMMEPKTKEKLISTLNRITQPGSIILAGSHQNINFNNKFTFPHKVTFFGQIADDKSLSRNDN